MTRVVRKALIFICLIALLLGGTLLFLSPKTTPPIASDAAERAIAEITDLELNGVNRRLLIRGHDLNNPLLLHIHG